MHLDRLRALITGSILEESELSFGKNIIWTSQVVLVVKNLPANAGDMSDLGSIPGWGRSPGGGHGNPLQFSCLENLMDRGAWWAKDQGVAKRRTRLKRLSMHSQEYYRRKFLVLKGRETGSSLSHLIQRGFLGRKSTSGLVWFTIQRMPFHSILHVGFCWDKVRWINIPTFSYELTLKKKKSQLACGKCKNRLPRWH